MHISERKQAHEFPQELLDIFDLYVHGDIDRREFLDRARRFAVGGVTAAMLLESLAPHYAWAQQVPKDDPRIKVDAVTVDSPEGTGNIKGFLSQPAGATGKLPAVLVVHENRGLNPYIEDVGRRVGAAGFLSLAVDGLTSVGGYPGTDEAGGKLFQTVDRAKMALDFVAAARWLKSHARSNGKVGVVGFCFGGGVSNNLAVRMGADLNAAVPYYGGQPAVADVPKIKAPLLIHYASLDKRINDGWPAYEEALKANGVNYTMHMYEGCNHGFHNDTTPRYNEEAAKLSWSRTLEFFHKHLRS
ncbi:MAG: dienelactone hydrolase family protein [Bryobacterales bacterium]|nr:dienelactone hydrolase family protein [Bryobacterales bacterium]